MRLRALSERGAVVAAALAAFGGGVAHAAPGSLDPSWSGDGRLQVNVGYRPAPLSFEDGAFDAQGRLVAAGSIDFGEIAVARYLPSGALDTAFAGDGIAQVAPPLTSIGGAAVAIDSEGRIVVAGGTSSYNPHTGEVSSSPRVVRLLPDGTLDRGFATDGIHYGLGNFIYSGVAIDAGDRIVAAGGEADEFVVRRLGPDGEPDQTFGTDQQSGSTALAAPGSGGASDLALDAAGRPVVVGNRNGHFVGRLTASGLPDPSFDGDGVADVSALSLGGYGVVATDSANRILLVGLHRETEFGELDTLVARLTPSGEPDDAFAGDGKAVIDLRDGGLEPVAAIEVDGEDRPVIGATSDDNPAGPSTSVHAARLTALGAPDGAFGDDGVATTDFGASASPTGLALDAAGRPAVLVNSSGDGSPRAGVVRFTAGGDPMTSFSGDGIVVQAGRVPGVEHPRDVAVDGSNRVLALTSTTAQTTEDSQLETLLERRTAAGGRDPAFGGGDGVVRIDRSDATDLALDGLGRILVLARSEATGTLILRRYTPNGLVDDSFDGDGAVEVEGWVAPSVLSTARVTVDAGNRPIVAGAVGGGGNADAGVWRYTTGGDPDTSFDGDGRRVINFGGSEEATAVALDGLGRIVVGGCRGGIVFGDLALARLTPGGALDVSFSGDGKVTGEDLGGSLPCIGDMVVDGSNRIVSTLPGLTSALVRVAANGTLDRTFGEEGVRVAPQDHNLGRGLALDGDGRILAAGMADPRTSSDVALARYGPNGEPDPAFDAGNDGAIRTEYGDSLEGAVRVAVGPDGRIVAAGTTGTAYMINHDMTITRYVGDSGAGLDRTLTTEVVGDGSLTGPGIACPGDCTQSFAMGDVALLTPQPAVSGAAWTGAACPDREPCPVSMDADRNVKVDFGTSSGGTRNLTVGISGTVGGGVVTGPGINCPDDCNEAYAVGTGVDLTAVPNPGFVFAGWMGGCGETASCNLTMSEDRQLTAVFTEAGGGNTDADGDGVHDPNDACPAVPAPGTADGCPVTGPTDSDGDGVLDPADACPAVAAPGTADGCPPVGNGDADGDGVPDPFDACPAVQALGTPNGCPGTGGGNSNDFDGDGVPDEADACPGLPGPGTANGCRDTGGGGGGGGGDGGGGTPPVPPVPTERTPEEVLAAASPDKVATAFGLPSARRCVSRRKFGIRLRSPRGVTIERARVSLNNKRIKTRRSGGRVRATVDLRGLPKGRFTVKIRITTATGKTLNGRRKYRTCAPKRRR